MNATPEASLVVGKRKIITRQQKSELANFMRVNPTPPEKVMLDLLDKHFPGRFKFQVAMEGYVVDFYCKRRRLILEVDGSHHQSQALYDKSRDSRFAASGIRTIRFSARRFRQASDLDEIVKDVRYWLKRDLIPVTTTKR